MGLLQGCPARLECVPIVYNAYFTEQEQEYAFVLANDEDVLVGRKFIAVLCAKQAADCYTSLSVCCINRLLPATL